MLAPLTIGDRLPAVRENPWRAEMARVVAVLTDGRYVIQYADGSQSAVYDTK